MGDELIIDAAVRDQYSPRRPTDPGTTSVHGIKSKLVRGQAFSEADAAAGQRIAKFLTDTQVGVDASYTELSDATETALRGDLKSEMDVRSVAMPIIEIEAADVPGIVPPTVGGR